MIDIKRISSAAQIQGGQKFVLVQFGKENGIIRHGNGVTITIDENEPDYLREMKVSFSIDDARDIAAKEGLKTIFIMV